MSAQTRQAFKEAFLDSLEETAASLLVDYLDSLRTDGTVDDKRKAVELAIRALGLETEKKQDANAALPVFNITFHNGGAMQMTAVGENSTQTVLLEPTPALLANVAVNADLDLD